MKKTILLRTISCILFLSLLLYPANSLVHHWEGNVFTGSFTEPCETSFVIFYDGYFLRFTSYHEDRIDMGYDLFKQILEKKKRKIENIAIKMHNHLPGGGRKFSDGDLKFWKLMKGDGFKGSYLLWYFKGVSDRR